MSEVLIYAWILCLTASGCFLAHNHWRVLKPWEAAIERHDWVECLIQQKRSERNLLRSAQLQAAALFFVILEALL